MASAVPSPTTIRVRLFARYAELLGTDSMVLPAEGPTTAGQVLALIRAMPGGRDLGSSTLIAINLKQASHDSKVVPGDEVAVLPPLAGG